MMNLEAIIWYALTLDCIIAGIVSLFFRDWYEKKLPSIYKIFPVTYGWCLVYVCLVIWSGNLLWRLKILPW